MLKGAFRSLAGEGAGPARILNRLDRLVAREGGDEDFVTALAGRLHPDGRILLASAGHPPPGRRPPPGPGGGPLGLGTQANESQGHLRPGDRLVCYTEGLVEAATPPASSSTARCSRRRSGPSPSSPPSTGWSSWSTGTPTAATTTTWPCSASSTTPRADAG